MKQLGQILLQIGRWILRRIIKNGRLWIIHYMQGKVEDFGRRLARAKTARRKKWLRGRIERWSKVIAWMLKVGEEFGNRDFKALDRQLRTKVALVQPDELDVPDAA